MPEYLIYVLCIGGLLTLAGPILLTLGRIADRENYIVKKATPMPLSLINVRDDVWLRGAAHCAKPLTTPFFDICCLKYDYTREERVTKQSRNSEGKIEYREVWEVREKKSDLASFSIVEGERSIRVDVTRARFKHLADQQRNLGDVRHSVQYFPYPSAINAIGSVSENRDRLEPYANIPLIVTTLNRYDYLHAAEKNENLLRWGGFTMIWVGVTLVIYGFLDFQSGIPSQHFGSTEWTRLLSAATPSLLLILVMWGFYKYNTLVSLRHRTNNAWRQVDVDLKMRHTLIPQLVSVVKRYLAHEKALLQNLATLRSETGISDRTKQIAAEPSISSSMASLRVSLEAYPELKAQPVSEKLSREIKAIEEKIAHARGTYNDTVMEYNTTIERFPESLIARLFGFTTMRYFPTMR